MLNFRMHLRILATQAFRLCCCLERLASVRAWEQIEPSEGEYNFSILDPWRDVARQQNIHLVSLWFGNC